MRLENALMITPQAASIGSFFKPPIERFRGSTSSIAPMLSEFLLRANHLRRHAMPSRYFEGVAQ